jgi:Predicted transcriptional regulator
MAVSYKKLWHLLLDKDMKKKDLVVKANLTDYSIRKLNKGENVTTEVIGKICKALGCTPDEIMEFIDDEQE